MRREWEPEDLIASWTLIKPDWELIGSKPGATRLGFAVLLKFFEIDSEKVRLEPPTFGQISRLVGSALRMFEERFCCTVEQRLDAVDGVVPRLEQVAGPGEDPESAAGGGERFLYELKTDPGVLGTETFRQSGRVTAPGAPDNAGGAVPRPNHGDHRQPG